MATPQIPGVSEVSIALAEHPEERALVMAKFRELGGNLDARTRDNARRMARALTYAEDTLELAQRGRWTKPRAALQEIRRRFEEAIGDG